MKHAFIILMALLLALCSVAYADATAVQAPEATLPVVGDALDGFTVTSVGRIDSLGADTVLLTHDKTNARVIFVLNDDTNLGFSICFHTEPSDDTGMLHILEHASCAASAKYPGRDVFFDAIAQAYLTGLNAWTSKSSTNYYATSMDENQLEVLADFYLDCSFNSALLTEPNYFYREGWRYEMPSLDNDLTINGIVYNEMQGAYGSIFNAATTNLQKTLFPDTYQSRDAGGIPENIPELSYDELISFYKTCYNPSNSVTMFYGDLDMERFLKLLNDGYFANADTVEISPVSAGQAPFAAPAYGTFEYPASADAEDTGAMIWYATALTDDDSGDYTNYAVCDEITTVLADESSMLMEALNASGIGSAYYVYVDRVGTQYTLNFIAENADATRDEEFKALVLENVAKMTDEGFDQDMLSAMFASSEMTLRLERNSGEVATTLFDSLIWIQEMDDYSILNKADFYKEAAALCEPGYVEGLVQKWVVDNPHAALVTTVPVPGLLEQNEAALAEKLAGIKAGMSDAEKQAIVDSTAAFSEWVGLETPQETLDKISVVTPENVSIEYPEVDITTETVDGIEIMTAPAEMDMVAVAVSFDLSHLSDSELYRLNMLQGISGCSTASHTQAEMSILQAENMCYFGSSVTVNQLLDENGEKTYRPVLAVSFYAPRESVAQAVELAMEILTQTDIAGNIDLLAQGIDSGINAYKNPETVYNSLSYTALASFNGVYGLIDKLAGMDNLAELRAASDEYKQDAAAFAESLAELRTRALTKTGALIMLVGDDGSARNALLTGLGALPEASGEIAVRDDLSESKNMALTGSTQASYMVRSVTLDSLSGETGHKLELTGDKLVLCQLLSGEYLLPNLRLKLGAYSTNMTITLNGSCNITYYRGDSLFEANELIDAMPDYIASLDMTQEQLDSYKLPVISSYLSTSGELNDALSAMSLSMTGFTREKRLEIVQEIIDTTVEDIKALEPLLREMLDNSAIAVITTADNAAAHSDEFDAIVKLP